MNIYNLQIFSQNVKKNKILTDIILEEQKNISDITLIQELPCYLIHNLSSNTNSKGDLLYSAPKHSEWLFLIWNSSSINNIPCIITYINKQVSKLKFLLRLNIINHWDINIMLFHNNQNINYIINVYPDNNQVTFQIL